MIGAVACLYDPATAEPPLPATRAVDDVGAATRPDDAAVEKLLEQLRDNPSAAVALVRPVKNLVTDYDTIFGIHGGDGTVTQIVSMRLRQRDGAFRIVISYRPDEGEVANPFIEVYARDSAWMWYARPATKSPIKGNWIVDKYDLDSENAKRLLDRPDLGFDGFYNALKPLWQVQTPDPGSAFDEVATLTFASTVRVDAAPAWATDHLAPDEIPEVALAYRINPRDKGQSGGDATVYARVTGGFRVLATQVRYDWGEGSLFARAIYGHQVQSGGLWIPTQFTWWMGGSLDEPMALQSTLRVDQIKVNTPLSDADLRWEPPFASLLLENNTVIGRVGYADPNADLGKDKNDRRLMDEPSGAAAMPTTKRSKP